MALQEKLRLASSAATHGNQQAASAAAAQAAALQTAVAAAEQQQAAALQVAAAVAAAERKRAAAEARVLELQQELEQEREQKTDLIQQNAELRRQLEDERALDPATPRAPTPGPGPGPQPPTPATDDLPPLPDSDSDDSTDSDGPTPPVGLTADNFGVLPPRMTGGNNNWTQFKHQSRQMAASLYRLLHNHTSDRPLQMNKLWVLQGETLAGGADQQSNNRQWAQPGGRAAAGIRLPLCWCASGAYHMHRPHAIDVCRRAVVCRQGLLRNVP